ncbi:AfsA-related hotdog domain-containing protein [Atopomonas hussainii]|uniref:AfsA-related hotdog domain-containing protein n=1 Tax=Atopomonas hussainii TaxID=1429083 RepID=UPI00090043DB|nr:AfsA-related hotdog domain-containing protein [Atopomonas hussainii]
MSVETVFVVGNKFKHFAENANVMLFNQLEDALANGQLQPRNVRVHWGQGVAESDINRLLNTYEGLSKSALGGLLPVRAGRRHVHKHVSHNGMISMPRRLTQTTFEVDVLLDERCAEMSDHVTGQHIQGMVLTEATRQTFLAVTEEFYLKEVAHSSYFVINCMDVEYLRFVFPLPISIHYEVLDHSVSQRSGSQRFDVRMSVIQGQQLCCVVKTKFATYPDAVIAEKEAGLAKAAIAQEIAPEMLHELRA